MSIAGEPAADGSLLIAAARTWRDARDRGAAVLPSLYAALAARGYGVLTPVLDSLLRLCEAALGRPIRTGAEAAVSDDEEMLLGLFAAPDGAARIGCPEMLVRPLATAFRSARIMIDLARPRPA